MFVSSGSRLRITGGADQFRVKPLITHCGFIPGKFELHGSLHQSRPKSPIAKMLAGALDSIPESFAGIVVTQETVSAIKSRVVILNNLLNTAGRARHRKRAVLQAVHSAESRRFEL